MYSANFLGKLGDDWKSGKLEGSPKKRKRTTVETVQAVEAVAVASQAEKENAVRIRSLNEKIEVLCQDKDTPIALKQVPNLIHELTQMEDLLTKELQLVTSAILKLSQLKS